MNTSDVLLKSHMYESAHKGPQGLGSRRPVISYIEKSHACFIYAAKVCYEILHNYRTIHYNQIGIFGALFNFK